MYEVLSPMWTFQGSYLKINLKFDYKSVCSWNLNNLHQEQKVFFKHNYNTFQVMSGLGSSPSDVLNFSPHKPQLWIIIPHTITDFE